MASGTQKSNAGGGGPVMAIDAAGTQDTTNDALTAAGSAEVNDASISLNSSHLIHADVAAAGGSVTATPISAYDINGTAAVEALIPPQQPAKIVEARKRTATTALDALEPYAPIDAKCANKAMCRESAPAAIAVEAKKQVSAEVKACNDVLMELFDKKHRGIAYPFYKPVDPELLNVPDYYDVIKNPMDLGTVKRKLDAGEYDSPAEFASDVRLIFANCQEYNPPEYEIVSMARRLQNVFEKCFANMLAAGTQHGASTARGLAAAGGAAANAKEKLSDELKYCNAILKELFAKKHSGYAWPFYQRIDAKRLCLRNYYEIMENPMDLCTIKRKMDDRAYKRAYEFATDVRSIFLNCYTYSPPDHAIVDMGRKLQEVFEMHYANLPEKLVANAHAAAAARAQEDFNVSQQEASVSSSLMEDESSSDEEYNAKLTILEASTLQLLKDVHKLKLEASMKKAKKNMKY